MEHITPVAVEEQTHWVERKIGKIRKNGPGIKIQVKIPIIAFWKERIFTEKATF